MFWSEHCDARMGHDLKHVHERDCPDGHVPGQCCECGRMASAWTGGTTTPAERRSDQPHKYRFTVTGRCAECNQTESQHLIELPEPVGGCTVDHNSITTRFLIGDKGNRWSSCPMCDTQVEPRTAKGRWEGDKYVPGEMEGRRFGRGRMPFTQRHWDELARIKAAFEGGYYQS